MKTVVVYYSYSGKTRAVAEQLAHDWDADLLEAQELKKRGAFSAYTAGILSAMRRKKAKLRDIREELSGYDRFVIAVPIWAGHPAPPFNNIVDMLPEGREVELLFTSGSGDSSASRAGTEALIQKRGCRLISYRDVKTAE